VRPLLSFFHFLLDKEGAVAIIDIEIHYQLILQEGYINLVRFARADDMKKRHLAVETLPRALWVIEGLLLYAGQYFSHRPPFLTKSLILMSLGTVCLMAGLCGWVHVAFSMRRAFFSKDLIVHGLFKYVRHPMYVAIYFALFGIGLLFFSCVWMMILALFIPVWYLVCKLEEKQMTEIWGQKYLEYQRHAGMFFPRLKKEGGK
jgi:protein-S-isoprenylcysteine O-methyltransferase Ste14